MQPHPDPLTSAYATHAARMRTCTYTRTYALMDAWASTVPWDCSRPDHSHSPMVGDPCAAAGCGEQLRRGEGCYAVTQLDRLPDGREQWVCWRHVRPDNGPITI